MHFVTYFLIGSCTFSFNARGHSAHQICTYSYSIPIIPISPHTSFLVIYCFRHGHQPSSHPPISLPPTDTFVKVTAADLLFNLHVVGEWEKTGSVPEKPTERTGKLHTDSTARTRSLKIGGSSNCCMSLSKINYGHG